MKRSLAFAAVRRSARSAAPRSPSASRRAASRPFSIALESMRSSSALRSGTLPISLRYKPIASDMGVPLILWGGWGVADAPNGTDCQLGLLGGLAMILHRWESVKGVGEQFFARTRISSSLHWRGDRPASRCLWRNLRSPAHRPSRHGGQCAACARTGLGRVDGRE